MILIYSGDKNPLSHIRKDFGFENKKNTQLRVSKILWQQGNSSSYYWQKFNSKSKPRVLEENWLQGMWDVPVFYRCVTSYSRAASLTSDLFLASLWVG